MFNQKKAADELTKLHSINSGVPQSIVLGPVLYILYMADITTTDQTITPTFAGDTTILASQTLLFQQETYKTPSTECKSGSGFGVKKQ